MKTIALQLVYTLAWLTVTASTPQNPPKSSAPDLEIVSAKWTRVAKPRVLLDPGAPSIAVSRGDNGSIPVVVPDPNIAQRTLGHTYYVYSAQVINRGEKEIKGLAWDFVFKDKDTHEELKRQLGYTTLRLHRNAKATMEIRTPSSPPKVIVAAAGPAYEEEIVIQCILFADGSLWASPAAGNDLCERMRPLFKHRSVSGVRPAFRVI